jgi:hypothetical protein
VGYWHDKMGMPDITSYAQLRNYFDQTQAYRGSLDKPFGHRKYNTRRMRELPDQSIELEYDKHALVRWHPDGTISVRAYDSRRQGGFDIEALPKQIRVGVGTRTGPIIYLYDTHKTDCWIIRPRTESDPPKRWPDDDNIYECNTLARVVLGSDWVHLKHDGKMWVLVDETKIKPFKWREPDRKRTRQVSAEWNIPGLVNAARACIALGNEDLLAESGWRGRRQSEIDEDAALAALKREDFTTAVKFLRRVETRTYDHNQGRWIVETNNVSTTDAQALRNRLYVITGLCEVQSASVLTMTKWRQVERLIKDFGSVE